DRMQGDITKHKNFVSDASHELKNPLTVIEGYAKILEKFGNADPSLRDESVIAIREEVQNMNKLIERLRSLTKSADGKTLQLNKENFNLAEMIDVAFQRAKNISTNHEIILVQNDSAQIFGDKTALLQMLRIFIDNAIKYTPEGGTIRLSSIRQDDKIFVSVADTGIGIAAENIDKLFVRGVRLTKDKYVKNVEGSGIGLDMAKKIADGHGITIDVESIVGKGTTFTLKIPLI
ncbi:MAG: two-component sensor histidine kinase, partial [Selenomonadaceae bacterium]|nr:two-component sensor histidine kinase [Selenomonadaceae bacterium]